MDKTTEKIVSYAMAFGDAEMTPAVREKTLHHLFDSVACILLGSGSEPARIAAKVASHIQNDDSASVFGYGMRTSPELAALANTMMVRTYDYNDGLSFRGSGHASDMISGILAAGEVAHSSGRDVITAIALGYEILGGLGFDIHLVAKGFDQGTFMGTSVALAAGRLLGLNEEQLGNAASLALIANVPMSVSRWGELSMMKGCATSFATRNGVLAALLAREGFTSAPEPFEGIKGLHNLVGKFEAFVPVNPNIRAIQMASIKAHPAEGNVQGLLDLVPKIRAWAPLADIESIDVDVADHLIVHLGDEPKYDPTTRETADHSLPYMLIMALREGRLTLDSYSDERIADPTLRPLMRKVKLHPSKAYADALWGQTQTEGVTPPRPAKITIRAKDGRVFEEEVMHFKGHPANPMAREDLDLKFETICESVPSLSAEKREQIREAWWNVEKAADIGEPIKTLTGFRSL